MQIDTERQERIARFRAKERERNAAAGIPDMDPGDRHEPAEWFAQLGFFAIIDKIGRSEPEHDWSDDGGDERDHDTFVAARRQDHQRVADWLRAANVKAIANRNGIAMNDDQIRWVDRVPALKVWAGQQTLAKIFATRQKALPAEVTDLIGCTVAIGGSSGLYKPCATTALEDGFSIDEAGMKRVTPIGVELLAIIGIDTVPLTVYPDGRIAYEVDGVRFAFRIEDRNDYYGRWGTAERVRG